MPSTFVQHHTHRLNSITIPPIQTTCPPSITSRTLHARLLSLESHPTLAQISETAALLVSLERDGQPAANNTDQEEEETLLKKKVLDRLAVGIYAETMDILLSEAIQIEIEAEWWANVESSRWNVAFYFLQTLPVRLAKLVRIVLLTLKSKGIAIRPSIFTPASLASLFPSTGLRRPNALITTLFPHLQHHPHLCWFILPGKFTHSPHTVENSALAFINAIPTWISTWTQRLFYVLNFPVSLTRQECRLKRETLEEVRDRKAMELGSISQLRRTLEAALQDGDTGNQTFHLAQVVHQLELNISQDYHPLGRYTLDVSLAIQRLADVILPAQSLHTVQIRAQDLFRPSPFTLLWPHYLMAPAALYAIHRFTSRMSLVNMTKEIARTAENFFNGYLLGSVRNIVNTIRSGGVGGIIIKKEGIAADLQSLERMSLSLAQEKLHYNAGQLELLSQQIRDGDLTPILKIYEDGIKNPWKSAFVGSLLRSAFIQIQKAKVDIDQALAGIDKLLKSQELTFAFVGVAPAFGVVYIVWSVIRNGWSITKNKSKYGGKLRRKQVLLAMRRLERLLICRSPIKTTDSITPTTAGLLLLSVTRLRTFAETYLPARSRLREGFLQDVEDLEDPDLTRGEKLHIVSRMWRSWGGVLKWGDILGDGR